MTAKKDTLEPDEVLVLIDKLKSYLNGEQT